MLLKQNEIKKVGETLRPQKYNEDDDAYAYRCVHAVLREQGKKYMNYMRSNAITTGTGVLICVSRSDFEMLKAEVE